MGSCLQGAMFPPARVFPASRETLPSRPFPPLLPLNLGLHCWPPLERPPPPRRHRPRGTGEPPSSKDCAAHPGNCRPAEGEGVPAAHHAPLPGKSSGKFPIPVDFPKILAYARGPGCVTPGDRPSRSRIPPGALFPASGLPSLPAPTFPFPQLNPGEIPSHLP